MNKNTRVFEVKFDQQRYARIYEYALHWSSYIHIESIFSVASSPAQAPRSFQRATLRRGRGDYVRIIIVMLSQQIIYRAQ